MSTPTGWKRYEDFAAGIDTNRLPTTFALVGRPLTITTADDVLELEFVAGDQVRWRCEDGSDTDWGEAILVAPDTYLVDITFRSRPREALTLVLDLANRRSLSVLSIVAPEPTPGQPQVSQIFSPGVLGEGALGGTEPAPSRDLIGLRAHYRYSPNHLYEHTYLSSERYCWQCLEGEQRGHGDVDLASVYKIAEGRYVFTFREFKIPVASVFFLNFEDRMSTGKFLGITGDGAIANNPAGATLQRMSQTFYPDVEPV
ncbi:MoaF C-terminal domain-containing protein [Phenylobacterium sp.]|jgi:hypothetical protein|uniref:MoaF C-terminal domain-containing protein n=1 Tax=Phenylobacterium sp. TaxID=1871053 RepID=UPI0035B34F6F